MERTTFVLPTNHMFIRQVFSDGNAVLYLSKKNMVSAEQKRELPKQINLNHKSVIFQSE